MRLAIAVLAVLPSIAAASPWQHDCAAILDAARKEAAELDKAFATVKTAPNDEGTSEEKVSIKLPLDRADAPLVQAVRYDKPQTAASSDWQSFDETAGNEYHLILERHLAGGRARLMLTVWKKPVASKLAEVFKPALDRCLAAIH